MQLRVLIGLQPRQVLGFLLVVLSALLPTSAHGQANTGCPSGIPVWDFYVATNGNVSDSGRTKEGPICVRVHYNRLRFNLAVNFDTTQSKGVDPSGVLLTGNVPGAGAGGTDLTETARNTQLDNIRIALTSLDRDATKVSEGIDSVKVLLAFLDNSIAGGGVFPEEVVKEKYKALRDALQAEQRLRTGILVPDTVTGACSQPPGNPAAGSALDTLQQYRADNQFYATNQKLIDDLIVLANLYRCGTPKQTALPTNVSIIKFWDNRFQELGLSTTLPDAAMGQLTLADFFVTSTLLRCGNIFNQSSSTTASLTTYDESQTLSGSLSAPNAQQDKNFFTITCASPFAVSAGVEFSTVPSREFAIVKSAGGANNTSTNEFGYSSQSSFHPLPAAIVHARIWESQSQRYAFHISAGASGNIQGQNSGGSSAEFLAGGSFSFFRTMFVTAGLHIGTKTSLAGGFKVGDTVPSDVTTVPVTKSYTTGFGIAITFTKP